jgi:hypothetical protein
MISRVAQQVQPAAVAVRGQAGAGARAARCRRARAGSQDPGSVTLLDRAHSHLKNGSGNGTRAVAGDALALPSRMGVLIWSAAASSLII